MRFEAYGGKFFPYKLQGANHPILQEGLKKHQQLFKNTGRDMDCGSEHLNYEPGFQWL